MAYAAGAAFWIVISDDLLAGMGSDASSLLLQTSKGLLFVLLTSALLYALVRRSSAALADSEKGTRGIVDSLADAVITFGEDRRVERLNPAGERLFAFSSEEAPGLPLTALLGPGLPTHLGHGHSQEAMARRRDGVEFPVHMSVSVLRGRSPRKYVAMVRDLSDRMQARAVAALVNDMDQRVLRGETLESFLPLMCEGIAKMVDSPLVWVGMKIADGTVDIMARGGRHAHTTPPLAVRWDRVTSDCAAGVAIREERLVAGNVMEGGEPEEAARSSGGRRKASCACDLGFASWVALPLRARQRVYGVLVVYGDRSNAFGEATTLRLSDLAERLGLALQGAIDHHRLRLQSAAMEAAVNAILITGADGRIEWVNTAFSNLSGYSADEVIGRTPELLNSGRHDTAFFGSLWETIQAGEVWKGEVTERAKDGSIYVVEQTITPLRNADGRITHFVAIHEDVTPRKRAEEQAQYLAHFDALTGLPNRVRFREQLEEAIEKARLKGSALALHFFDLDRFKDINDSLGQHVGDLLLREVVSRIGGSLRATDGLARIGGDEFAVTQMEVGGADGAVGLARKMIDRVAQPFLIDGHEIHAGICVGVTVYPADGNDADQLIRHANMAMYRAKGEGRNAFHLYATGMDAEAHAQLEVESDLHRAIARREFELHYQPQIDIGSGRMVGAEALIRWRHPERGLVYPAAFIPLAEERGLINPIGAWVLEEACRQLRVWRESGLAVVPVSVNISAAQFKQRSLVAEVLKALTESGNDPALLELELTESMVMQDPETAVEMLHRLHALGVGLAIDDFGTGYSSLTYLKRFPLDRLKIDRSFVRDLVADSNDAAIARAVVRLGHSLNLKVVSEGVETEEQLAFMRREGCDIVQGYYFSRPLPADQFAARLAAEPPAAVAVSESGTRETVI